MSAPASDAVVAASTTVSVDPETAFDVFTREVDAWWKHGPRFRTGAPGASTLHFEPGVGGRLIERFDADAEPFVLGRIVVWQPPDRLLFEMRGRDFGPDDRTEVEVRFEPVPSGTRVTVEHRGWERFAPDHPVRHGLQGDAFTAMMGVFWGDLLVSLQMRAREGKRGT
jgi:uncharacterized protein YndB with AHSA1/START domain